MNRRDFLGSLGALTLGAALPRGAAANATARPDILLILLDDLGAYLGSSRSVPAAITPHTDALAARGTVFDRAYCPAPLCNPSRAAALSGVPPYRSGVYWNNQPWRSGLKDALTLQEYFRANGYHSLGAGKIMHALRGGPSPVDNKMWDEYLPQISDPITREIAQAAMNFGPLDVADEAMGDCQLALTLSERIALAPKDKPLITTAGFFRPHAPLYSPRSYFDLYKPDEIPLPPAPPAARADLPEAARKLPLPLPPALAEVVKDPAKRRALVHAYLAAVSFADACVGRLLAGLEASGRADRTIVLVAGDNGMHFGQQDWWLKTTLWDEATRVPFIALLPGISPPGSRCARVVNLQDIYPTLADLAGLPARREVAGRSIRPLLADPTTPWDFPTLSTMGRGNHAVISERYHYIRYADGSEELYDRERDPNHWHNMANAPEAATVKADLARALPENEVDDVPRIEKASW